VFKLLLIVLLFVAAVLLVSGVRKRTKRASLQAAARARAAARRKPSVPAVSNNLKGVTASQTIQPYKPGNPPRAGGDGERAV
jgi:hypothetical protein